MSLYKEQIVRTDVQRKVNIKIMSIWIFLKIKYYVYLDILKDEKKKKAEVFKNSSAHNDIMIKIQKKNQNQTHSLNQ